MKKYVICFVLSIIPNARNNVRFERVKTPKIIDRKRHSIVLILCRLRSMICRQFSRSSNLTLFLAFGIIPIISPLQGASLFDQTEVQKRFERAFAQNPTLDLNNRVDKHKGMIAAYCLREGDWALDIGAHLGCFAFYVASFVGESGRVIAYEPNPYPLELLLARVNARGTQNISVVNKAVSDTSGYKIPMKVYRNDPDPQSCTVEPILMEEGRMPGNTEMIEVETYRLDELLKLKEIARLKLIKIDTEGHEHAVIRGAQRLLSQVRPLVIFEYGFVKGYFEPNTIQQMEDLGYFCYEMYHDRRVRPGFEISVTDLVGVPIERALEFETLLPRLHY